MPQFDRIKIPADGKRITWKGDALEVPDYPVIPVIEGDGIGPDIMCAARRVLDAAVNKIYSGQKKIAWMDIYAGDSAAARYAGNVLPDETVAAIQYYHVSLKGPLTTPVGGGFRSLNVSLRQMMDLYACVRPVNYFVGVPSPVRAPQKMDVVIFRENTEDVYAGIEWSEGSPEAVQVIQFLKDTFGTAIRIDSGIGIKPISITGTKRLVRMAIQYAIKHDRPSVTMVHKGNIMKFTEGAFRDWGYEVAREEFPEHTITEDEVWAKFDGQVPTGKIVIKDRIADSMLQQILTRTDEYDVIATPNLNGDYLSDACAAQVGGLGLAPGANIGDKVALFEATHGTAPKYANLDKVNPSSVLLSGVMMLEHLGWQEAADVVVAAVGKTIRQKKVTYDLARLMGDIDPLKTSEYATAIIANIA